MESEKLLIEACKRNDRKAQHTLYHKYNRAMFNVCYRMVGDYDQASDVLQNAFVDVFRKLDTYHFQSTIGSWIKRIAINKSIDHIRKNKKAILERLDDQTNIAVPEERTGHVNYNVSTIIKAVEELPEGYRMVFSLYAIEGYDHEEIAMILGVSKQTSKSQYHRAKIKIRKAMEDKGLSKKSFEL